MKKHNIITACLVIVTIIVSSFSCLADVTENEPTGATGLIFEEIDAPSLFDVDPELRKQLEETVQQNKNARSIDEDDGLSNYADLSESEYFPEIGDQKGVGDCAAFATTYYQFTYAKNKLLGIETTYANSASPQATYNLVYNKAEGEGSTIKANYDVLKLIGAPKMSQFPNRSINENWDRWVNNITAQREALNVRLENYYSETVDTANNPITYTDDLDLLQIKFLVGAGYPLAFATCWDYVSKTSSSFGEIIIRGNAVEGVKGHAMTIVGYNDNVYYDVNKNGSIENAERGAFKVANSHTTNFGNQGFIWVLYDAMNVTSQISGNWESVYTKTRHPFFSGDENDGINTFSYIRVKNTKPLFVGELTVRTNKPKTFSAYNTAKHTFVSNPNNAISDSFIKLYEGRGGDLAFSGKLLFPFDDELFTSDIEMKSIYCRLSVSDSLQNNILNTTSLSYRITDNRGNTINSYGAFSLGNNWNTNYKFITKEFYIDTQPTASQISNGAVKLNRGDINFDGVINSTDSDFIMNMSVGNVEYSFAQEFFADVNKDGVVSVHDALDIM